MNSMFTNLYSNGLDWRC